MTTTTEEHALLMVEAELKRRGWLPRRNGRSSPRGDIEASHPSKNYIRRIEVKGLRQRSAVWLKRRQVDATDFVAIAQLDETLIWIFSK